MSTVNSKKPVVAVSVNMAWNIANFRLGLIKALIREGYDVVAIAPHDSYVEKIEATGCRFLDVSMGRKSTNPIADFFLFVRLFRALKEAKPSVFLGYTVKPNVYGSLACRLLGVPVINNIAGLGSVFLRKGWLERFVFWLYSFALAKSRIVFFQNSDDKHLFVHAGVVLAEQAVLIPGSGVDVARFCPGEVTADRLSHRFTFLVVARLLWDKGIGEFVDAARELRKAGVEADFFLLGFLDSGNPSGISKEVVDEWEREGVVRYLGQADDVRPYLSVADCVVLPSYREGTPRSLLEAASMSAPIITTDAPGCRDVVADGVTGFVVPPRNSSALADAMTRMVELSSSDRLEMGRRARSFVIDNYDERLVVGAYLNAIKNSLV